MMNFFWEQVRKRERIVRYIISGSTATGVNLILLYFFTDWLGFWYLASAVVAFIIGFFTSFFLQKIWTFQDGNYARAKRQLTFFSLISLMNLLGNTLLMYALVDIFKVWYVLAQAMITVLIAFWNYNAFRLFVFKPAKITNE